jgi:hypothetical protein
MGGNPFIGGKPMMGGNPMMGEKPVMGRKAMMVGSPGDRHRPWLRQEAASACYVRVDIRVPESAAWVHLQLEGTPHRFWGGSPRCRPTLCMLSQA